MPPLSKGPPTRLRTRLATAFAVFALTAISGFGLLVAFFWERSPGQLAPILFTASMLVIAIAALAGYLLAGPLARPMEQWADVADRIGLGERDVAFPRSGGSHELSRVSTALQSMFARLTEKEDALQERISERTNALLEATQALEAERMRLAAALESSRLAFWDLDVETGVIQLSVEWSRMLGVPETDTTTTGTELLLLVPEEEHEAISTRLFACLKGTDPNYDVDHRIRKSDGTYIWIRSRGRVVGRTPDGQALRMIGTNADVSTRKLSEVAQKESEARLRTVMDGVASSICHIDLSGRILFANRRYHELFSLADGDAIGRNIRDIAGPTGASAFERAVPQLLCGVEVRYERDIDVQGQRGRIEVQLVPHRDDLGVTDSAYAVITDLNARKHAAVESMARAHT